MANLPTPSVSTSPSFFQRPPRAVWALVTALALSGALTACALVPAQADVAARLQTLGPAPVLLVGEQHDAAEHQRLQQQLVSALAQRGELAALALEMASAGRSTAGLPATASEAEVREALQWGEAGWPWPVYGPVVMAAVRAGVPVLGANLPPDRLRASMADVALDQQLPGPALKAQQQLIRQGHCDLLPPSQITPMTRVQIARDQRMAQTVAEAARQAKPGQRVVLISGSAHADRQLGVPQHLPRDLPVLTLRLRAGDAVAGAESFDVVWATPALPPTDYCQSLREQFKPAAGAKPAP